jgi:hypothetical protein
VRATAANELSTSFDGAYWNIGNVGAWHSSVSATVIRNGGCDLEKHSAAALISISVHRRFMDLSDEHERTSQLDQQCQSSLG